MDLSAFLDAASCLVDSPTTAPSRAEATLIDRLTKCYSIVDSAETVEKESVADLRTRSLAYLQSKTADASIFVLQGVQRVLEGSAAHEEPPASSDAQSVEVPLIGTRDLSHLRTLLSIVFKWGTEPLLMRLAPCWIPSSGPYRPIENAIRTDFAHLSQFNDGILTLLFSDDLRQHISQTLITNTAITRHLADILRLSIALGCPPTNFSPRTGETIRPVVVRLLNRCAIFSATNVPAW
jgi:hypothetical protein